MPIALDVVICQFHDFHDFKLFEENIDSKERISTYLITELKLLYCLVKLLLRSRRM